jgi:hypothetical protein
VRFLSILINFIKSLFRKDTTVEDSVNSYVRGLLLPYETETVIPPKSAAKKAAITRRRKAQKLSELSKPKRRAVYYYNLRHPQKMYA